MLKRKYRTDPSNGTDVPTVLFDTAIIVMGRTDAQQMAKTAGNFISLSLHYQGAWPEALQYELDPALFRAALVGFRTPDSEISQRATGLSMSIWRSSVAGIQGRSAFAIHLGRKPDGERTLEFATTHNGATQRYWYLAPDDMAHNEMCVLLFTALNASAPHDVIKEGPLFMQKPAGQALS